MPRRAVSWVHTFVLVAATFGPGAHADAAVVVIETRPVVLPGIGARALRNTVEAAIKSQGGDIVRSGTLPAAATACTTSDCLRQVSDATGATHVLRVDGSYANDGYELYMEMWSAGTGQTTRGQSRKCLVCSTSEMLANARDQATLLYGAQLRAQAPVEPSGARSPPAVAPAPVPQAPDTGPRPGPGPRPSLVAPALVVGAGLGLGLAGGYLLTMHGEPAKCRMTPEAKMCFAIRDTKTPGILMVGAGVIAAAVGAVVLLMRLDGGRSTVSLAVGPDGLLLAGGF